LINADDVITGALVVDVLAVAGRLAWSAFKGARGARAPSGGGSRHTSPLGRQRGQGPAAPRTPAPGRDTANSYLKVSFVLPAAEGN
jgi:hypothetical protein